MAARSPAETELLGIASRVFPGGVIARHRLPDERALVFTLDFFPPLVDDAALFGAIAATNALNDVFAMGGTPLLALSIAAFPEDLPSQVLADCFAAADLKVREAGALLAGGQIPAIILSQTRIQNGLIGRDVMDVVQRRCRLDPRTRVGPGWTVWRCTP